MCVRVCVCACVRACVRVCVKCIVVYGYMGMCVSTHACVCVRERKGERTERRSGLFGQTQVLTSVGPVGSYLMDPHVLSIFGVKCSLLE